MTPKKLAQLRMAETYFADELSLSRDDLAFWKRYNKAHPEKKNLTQVRFFKNQSRAYFVALSLIRQALK